ncbi:MAG: hypothetical protein IKS41_04255 [Alphaproteobacteria bacterium]|nr:hypothetical protein [Alphaproteobacteria bacterium]
MKTPILKAVAMPPRMFWAPMLPAIINLIIQGAVMILLMVTYSGQINPNVFMFTIVGIHVCLIAWGTQEPHLSTIIPAWGQARSFWDKEDKIKSGVLDPKVGTEGIIINNRRIRIIRLNGDTTFAANWCKWLMTMARYPVSIHVWQSDQDGLKLILSAPASESYRFKEAVQDTLSLLREFSPEELDPMDSARLFTDMLTPKAKFLKQTGVFVAQNSRGYTAVISVNRPGNNMDTDMIADLLSLDGDIKIDHSIQVIPSVKVNSLLLREQKMAYFTTFSRNVYEQYTAALEAIDSLSEFPQVAVNYAMATWITAPTMAELEGLLVQVVSVFKQYGFQVIREKEMARAYYVRQFTDSVIPPRRFLLLSDGVVSVLNLSPHEGQNNISFGARF